MAIAVENYTELMRTLKHAPKDVRLGVRKELRVVAEPVKSTAETLAMSTIRRMPYSPKWAKFRVGISQTEVYVAPRQRGIKSRGYHPRRRGWKFSNMMAEQVTNPALEQNEHRIEQDFDDMLDRLVTKWDHDGP